MSCTFKSEQDQNKPLGAWKSGSSSTSRRISYPLYLSGTSFRLGRFSDFSFLFGLTGAAFFSSSGSSTYSKNHVYSFKISLFEFYNIFYKYCTSCFKSTNITFIFYFDKLIQEKTKTNFNALCEQMFKNNSMFYIAFYCKISCNPIYTIISLYIKKKLVIHEISHDCLIEK